MKFQIVPPNRHRTKAPERAISTFKDYFISGLASVDPSLQIHLWCILLPIATTTLSLLPSSYLHPKISAEALLNGAFDYNKTPISLLDTKVIVHKTPANQKMWSSMGLIVGILIEHLNITVATSYISQRRAAR